MVISDVLGGKRERRHYARGWLWSRIGHNHPRSRL